MVNIAHLIDCLKADLNSFVFQSSSCLNRVQKAVKLYVVTLKWCRLKKKSWITVIVSIDSNSYFNQNLWLLALKNWIGFFKCKLYCFYDSSKSWTHWVSSINGNNSSNASNPRNWYPIYFCHVLQQFFLINFLGFKYLLNFMMH